MKHFVVALSLVSSLFASSADEALSLGEYKKAFNILSKEAKRGDAKAEYNLALMYYMGDGVEQNISMSAILLERSASQGYSLARKNVGRIFMQLIKFDKAIFWLKQNAKEGDIQASYLLAEIYVEKEEFVNAKSYALEAMKGGSKEAQELCETYKLSSY